MRHLPAWIIISCYTFIAALAAIPILGDQNFYSDDLAGHIALILRMSSTGGDPWFYDRAWFGGFPAFEFYGFLPHWLASCMVSWFGGGWTGATKAVHAVMALCIVLLPASTWWFARGWQMRQKADTWLLAGSIVIVLSVFLTVTEPKTPAGTQYLVTGGVYGQLPGWVLMFLYLGTIGRLWSRSYTVRWISALLFSLVMATHPLTAIGALLVGIVLLANYDGLRPAIAHGIAMIATSAWFWLPLMMWSTSYGASIPYSGDATVVSVLFDGWLDFFNDISVSSWDLLAELLVASMLVVAIYFGVWRGDATGRASLLLLLVGLLLAGDEATEAFFLGLHYDRLVVLLAVVTALMAAATLTDNRIKLPRYARMAFSGSLLLIGAQVTLSVIESQPWLSSMSPEGYYEEERLLWNLKNLPASSRVYFEYAKSRSETDVEPGKFVESKLWSIAGRETVNGLLVQSSRPYQLYVTVVAQLGGHSFGVPPIGEDFFTLTDEGIVDVLRRNSVSHLVSANQRFGENLETIDGIKRIGTSGRYTVYAVKDYRDRLVPVSKPLVGYVDLQGNLPFRYMDTFVETRSSLSGHVRLVSLRPEEMQSVSLDGLIINMEHDAELMEWKIMDRTQGGKVPALGIHFDPSVLPRRTGRSSHHEKRQYERVAAFLWESEFERLLHAFASRERSAEQPVNANPGFRWSEHGQGIKFTDLMPGKWYEFSYSFFPAWRTDDAILRRGSGGHWFFQAAEPNMHAEYGRWRTYPVINGWIISILALVACVAARYRRPRGNWAVV